MEEGYLDVGAMEVVLLFEEGGRLRSELLVSEGLVGLAAFTDRPRERRMSEM